MTVWADLTPAGQLHVIYARLQDLNRKVDQLMSDQSHIEADVAGIEAAEQSEAASIAAIQKAFDDFKAANPGVNFDSMDKAFADAQANAASFAAQVTADTPTFDPPAPDPAPTPDPAPPAA